ncbi:MAG: zinc metalloprotease [Actinobacteria bacterium 13_1_20CM_3_71_11]|nr:MAG: zinc metalloprotease [Actinobacteria bacterium 13_1_20CM_3_71_11]
MAYLLGVVLFALAIFISVCLHEAGHMLTAKAFGMKVSRYFAGFGPTLWSFRRGETEYGLKGIPLGGFVKIVGMTPQDDDVAPEDQPRAMWRYSLWKRTVVMSAGSVTHFLLGFVVLWITLVFVGVPNPAVDPTRQPAMITVAPCVYATDDAPNCAPTDPAAPAKLAGLQDGDVITSLDGKPIHTYDDLQKAIRASKFGPVDVTYQRDGRTETTVVALVPATRHPLPNADGTVDPQQQTVPALGVGWQVPPSVPLLVTYGPGESVKQSVAYTGRLFGAMGSAIGRIPAKVPALWNSLSGKPRDPNTPISVVGASRLGGETVQHGAWWLFLNILITLNFFIGVFNLLPLLPLDGGHIAIAFFERIRSWIYARLRRPDPGRVNYLKLMPFTYVVILIFGGFTLLTVAADIVNPITLFGK